MFAVAPMFEALWKQVRCQNLRADFQPLRETAPSKVRRERRELDETTNLGSYVFIAKPWKMLRQSLKTFWPCGCYSVSQAMDQAAIIAASGLRARMQALDLLSNNLANSSSSGYKLDREFYSLYNGGESATGLEAELPFVKGQWTDFSQGTLTPTGNPLDLALTGQGFFVATGPTSSLYTRNGSFHTSSSGTLVTEEGYPVQGVNGTIQTKSQQPVDISEDGTVRQNGSVIGQLKVVDFPNRAILSKAAGSYFTNSDPKAKPVASQATVSQGRLEQSNVAPAESAVRLVDVMRQFEMLQKAIMTTTDMNKQAIQEVARVGGGQ
jgi:flagellar basal-body rod protein FlgF